MGEYVTKLAALAGVKKYGMGAAFTAAAEALGGVALAAQTARSDVGFTGEAGTAAESQLEHRRRALISVADAAADIPDLISQANEQLSYARRVSRELADRTYLPLGAVGADGVIAGRKAFDLSREQDAEEAYRAVTKELKALAARLAPLAARLRNGAFPGTTASGQTTAPGALRALAQLTPEQLAKLTEAQQIRLAELLSKDPEKVAGWWASLTADQRAALLANASPLLGRLDGLPAQVRVDANRENAVADLAANAKERDRLQHHPTAADGDAEAIAQRIALLDAEDDYLEAVKTGAVQLYLYDRDASRIVEIVGDLSHQPTNVIYYNPGTFTGLPSFWSGGASEFADALVRGHDGALVFVTKDGVFPGEDDDNLGDPDLLRITEANAADSTDKTAARLAALQAGLGADPYYAAAQQVAIGHSWGLANVTASEQAGAHYDEVISLSGAWMPKDWTPDPDTSYVDYSYPDALQLGQDLGLVGGNNVPRRPGSGFDYDGYYSSPDPHDLLGNHNLIVTDEKANQQVIKDIRKGIYG